MAKHVIRANDLNITVGDIEVDNRFTKAPIVLRVSSKNGRLKMLTGLSRRQTARLIGYLTLVLSEASD